MNNRERFKIDPTLSRTTRGQQVQIPTYEHSGVAIHPSVYFDPQGWNGFEYWMAFTPYPRGDNSLENPSIVASHDGSRWVVPPGLTNPIEPPPPAGSPRPDLYHSDPNLAMGSDGRMNCVFRTYDARLAGQEERLICRSSMDGSTWSTSEVMRTDDRTERRLMSPSCAQLPDNSWVMYAVNIASNPRRLVRLTAPHIYGPWTTPTDCTITGTKGVPWHADIRLVGDQWQGLISDGGSAGGDLWATASDDGVVFRAGPAFPRGGALRFVPSHRLYYPLEKKRPSNGKFRWPRRSALGEVHHFVGRASRRLVKLGPWDALYYKSCFVPAIRDGQQGWDAWIGGGNFPATGSILGRTFVSFNSDP